MKRPAGVGTNGEAIAERFLIDKGYRILEKNFRNEKGRQLGEIDIIAQSGPCIVFVEVKTRVSAAHQGTGKMLPPESAISYGKLERLRHVGEYYLRLRRFLDRPHRYDAVAIVLDTAGEACEIRHIEDVFF